MTKFHIRVHIPTAATFIALAVFALPAGAADWKSAFTAGEQRLAAHDLHGAEAYFQQALAAVKKQKHTPSELAKCLEALAAVMQQLSETDDVVPLYKKAVRIEQLKGAAEAVPVLISLGKVYEAETHYKKAANVYGKALAAAPPRTLVLAECEHLLGRAEFNSGNIAKAESAYRSALATIMAQPELPSTALLEEVLGDYLDLYRKSDERQRNIASVFQKELLKDNLSADRAGRDMQPSYFSKEVYGELAETLQNKAALPAEAKLPPIIPDKPMSDFAALEQINRQRVDFYERMIATDINSLGAQHPSVARDLSGLAGIYIAQKKYSEAEPLLKRAEQIYRTTYGADALITKRTSDLLNLISEGKQGVDPLAKPTSEYLKTLPRVPVQTGKLDIALSFNRLALLAYSRGQIEDAAKFYAWALADTALATGQHSPLVAACLTDYGKVLRTRGQHGDAEMAEKDAHNILSALRARQTIPLLP